MSGSRTKFLRKLGVKDYLRAHKIYGNRMRSFKSYFRRLKKLYIRKGAVLWQGKLIPS